MQKYFINVVLGSIVFLGAATLLAGQAAAATDLAPADPTGSGFSTNPPQISGVSPAKPGSGPCSVVDGDYPCHGIAVGNWKAAGTSYVTDNVQNDNMSCMFDIPPFAPCHNLGVPKHGWRELTWLSASSVGYSNGTANRPKYTVNFGAWNNTRLSMRWYIQCEPYDDDPANANITAHLNIGGRNSKKTPFHSLSIHLVCNGKVAEIDESNWDQLIPANERQLNWRPHIEFAFNPNNLPGNLGNKYDISISAWSMHQSNPSPPIPL